MQNSSDGTLFDMKQFSNAAEPAGTTRAANVVPPTGGDRFGMLMLSILLMILIRPFLEEWVAIGLLTDVLFVGIFLSGIYAARGGKYRYRLALLLAGVGLATRIAHHVHGGPVVAGLAEVTGALFLVHVLVNIADHIRGEREVTRDLIFAGVCAYLLVGMLWAYAYYFLERWHPGSFKATEPLGDDL